MSHIAAERIMPFFLHMDYNKCSKITEEEKMNTSRYFIVVLIFFSLISPHTSAAQDLECMNGPTTMAQNGMYVYEYCTLVSTVGTDKMAYMVLAADWTNHNSGMVFAAKTTVAVFENWNIKSATLAQNWTHPTTGMIFKKKTEVSFYKAGTFEGFTLAANWKDESTGKVFKGGSEIALYEDGRPKQCTYTQDVKLENGMIMKGGQKVLFHQNGNLYIFTLAAQWQHPTLKFKLKGGTQVAFFNNGTFENFTPANDLTLPGTDMVVKGGYVVVFNGDGTVYSATLAKPWTDPKTGIKYGTGKKQNFKK
jgi:hypothetical protein